MIKMKPSITNEKRGSIRPLKNNYVRMKYWFLFAAMAVFAARSQPRYEVATGEYHCYVLDNPSHRLYSVTTGMPSPVEGLPLTIKGAAAGAHHALAIDGEGAVWAWGSNRNGECGTGAMGDDVVAPRRIETDSAGRPFLHVVAVNGGGGEGGWASAALKSDGTVWVWGNTRHGIRGNGSEGGDNPKPVQVVFPKGIFIVKVLVYQIGVALDAEGKVWTWGGGGQWGVEYWLGRGEALPNLHVNKPGIVPLPGPAMDIAGGRQWNYALLRNHSLYGWGNFTAYLGIGDKGFAHQPPAALRPQPLDAVLRLPARVSTIYTNTVATYAILQDSTLWAWGDNAVGAIGNGQELDYESYPHSVGVANGGVANGGAAAKPYAWDWGPGELLQQKPVHIAEGLHSFTHVWTGNSLVFYAYAEDVHGRLYSWGRNKGCVLGNGVVEADREMGHLGGEYPNSWDEPMVTPVWPLELKRVYRTTSPLCMKNPGAKACNLYMMPTGFEPKAVVSVREAGTRKGEIVLDGSGSHDNEQDSGKGIIRYRWKQLAGPVRGLIVIPSMASPLVSRLVPGNYTFELVVTDNGWKSDSAKITVRVPG
jgi:alpha-tubulin suppressor-like RCC1 family protein